MQVFLDHIYRYKSTTTRLSVFACQKDAAGAALKKGGSGQQKIGSGSTLKGAAPAPQHCKTLHMQFSRISKQIVNCFSCCNCSCNPGDGS